MTFPTPLLAVLCAFAAMAVTPFAPPTRKSASTKSRFRRLCRRGTGSRPEQSWLCGPARDRAAAEIRKSEGSGEDSIPASRQCFVSMGSSSRASIGRHRIEGFVCGGTRRGHGGFYHLQQGRCGRHVRRPGTRRTDPHTRRRGRHRHRSQSVHVHARHQVQHSARPAQPELLGHERLRAAEIATVGTSIWRAYLDALARDRYNYVSLWNLLPSLDGEGARISRRGPQRCMALEDQIRRGLLDTHDGIVTPAMLPTRKSSNNSPSSRRSISGAA